MSLIKKFVLRMPVSTVSALDRIREKEGGYSRNRFILMILQDYIAEYSLESFAHEECIFCGCTDDNACEGGCSWVLPGLCSKCAEKLVNIGFTKVTTHPDELKEVLKKHEEWDGKSPHPYDCVGSDPDAECFEELDEQLGKKQ